MTHPRSYPEGVALADELTKWVEKYALKICPPGCLPLPAQEREINLFARIAIALRDPAQRPAKPDSLKTFSKIKALALNTKPEDVRDALAHIVRLCIDAGSRPPFDRNWTEDASHENGNYECLCCECGQVFIGHKRRVLCKACSGLLTSALPSTESGSGK